MKPKINNSVKIIVGGDVCPIGCNEFFFCDRRTKRLMGTAIVPWLEADLRIINLECPLIKSPSPIRKTGPHLGAKEQTVNGLKKLKIDLVGLANNHIMDHGSSGLFNTIRLLKKTKINLLGAGQNLAQAQKPITLNVKNTLIGFIAMTDLEWSVAGYNSPGANPFSFPSFLKSVRLLKRDCDHIITILHLGKEHYPYPSPKLQEVCRCIIDEGVSVVICQHSHCIGASEHYKNGFISYGQGNFIFDSPDCEEESWKNGYLLNIDLSPNNSPSISFLPIHKSDNGIGINLFGAKEMKKFHTRMKKMELEIQDPEFVDLKWSEFCKKNQDLYFSILSGHNRLFRGFNRMTGFKRHFYTNEAIAILENVLRCKAHHEVLETILSNIRKENWKSR